MSEQCASVSDYGDRCVKPEGHPGTSYLHETDQDDAGMITAWGAPPEGTELAECPECDHFAMIAAEGTVVIAHDHTDDSHSWIRSDGDIGSVHIAIIEPGNG